MVIQCPCSMPPIAQLSTISLFMLVVRTNVEYIPVAQFVTEDETSKSIQEALQILRNWNPDWCPAYFMVDYSEAEMNSIKAEFESNKILLCAFHREQTWERWSCSGNTQNIKNLIKFLKEVQSNCNTPNAAKIVYCTCNVFLVLVSICLILLTSKSYDHCN